MVAHPNLSTKFDDPNVDDRCMHKYMIWKTLLNILVLQSTTKHPVCECVSFHYFKLRLYFKFPKVTRTRLRFLDILPYYVHLQCCNYINVQNNDHLRDILQIVIFTQHNNIYCSVVDYVTINAKIRLTTHCTCAMMVGLVVFVSNLNLNSTVYLT